MCPIVPTFTCGFVRSNFSFAIISSSSALSYRLLALSPKLVRVPRAPLPAKPLLPALRLAYNFVGYAARHFFVAREVHRVFRAALSRRSHVRCISEHLCQRNDGLDHLRTSAVLHAFNASAARTQVAHDRSREIF